MYSASERDLVDGEAHDHIIITNRAVSVNLTLAKIIILLKCINREILMKGNISV